MVIEWDVPVTMDDGVVLCADVFRPDGPDRHPVILTYGPYAKGLAFQEGYADQWRMMVAAHPDVSQASSNRGRCVFVGRRGGAGRCSKRGAELLGVGVRG